VDATKLTPAELSSEAMLAIGAGSDTTATAILNTVFYLITHPAVFARLRQELDECSEYSTTYDQPLDSGKLADLKYLQAVINETLRLQPAVPNGVQRTTPRSKGVVSLAQ
jgi:cytochrome P450